MLALDDMSAHFYDTYTHVHVKNTLRLWLVLSPLFADWAISFWLRLPILVQPRWVCMHHRQFDLEINLPNPKVGGEHQKPLTEIKMIAMGSNGKY